MFAIGLRVRELPEAVTKGLRGIHYLRTLVGADLFALVLQMGKRVLIVNRGYIGFEDVVVCPSKGMDVILVEVAE